MIEALSAGQVPRGALWSDKKSLMYVLKQLMRVGFVPAVESSQNSRCALSI